MRNPDVLIIGAGIVGLTLALTLLRREPRLRLCVIDKERRVGAHASGRNSGVLHAGFYYSPDSLKARYSAEGNRRWQRWCEERGLPVERCGKLVVARSEADHAGLDELLARARRSGVPLEAIDEAEARRIEPRARTLGRAAYSPSTGSVDPRRCTESVARAARQAGADLRLGVAYIGRIEGGVRSSSGSISAGFVVNTAGLYADRIARDYGMAEGLRILPFKGLYLLGTEHAGPLACHIYPVPDLRVPFLGVHLTRRVGGQLSIGPTALPAPWREAYGGMDGLRLGELHEVGCYGGWLLARNPGLRRLALREIPKLSRMGLIRPAASLLRGLRPEHFPRFGPPGIRAQLVDTREQRLIMDFVARGDGRSLHVLNAISPAFTCAFPMAEELADRVLGQSGSVGGEGPEPAGGPLPG